MGPIDANDLIDGTLRKLWEPWTPNEYLRSRWITWLGKYDFKKTRQAIGKWYDLSENPGFKPIMGKLSRWLGGALDSYQEASAEWVDVFGLQKQGTHVVKRFVAKTMPEPHIAMQQAEAMRKIYGKDYDIIRLWDLPEKKPCSEITGEPARLAAYDRILNGPDCKAKTWLTAHVLALADKESREARQRQIEADLRGKNDDERLVFAGRADPGSRKIDTAITKARAKLPQDDAVRIGEVANEIQW